MFENLLKTAHTTFAEIDGNITELTAYASELREKAEKATARLNLTGAKKAAALRSELQQVEETLERAKARRVEMTAEFSQGISAEIDSEQNAYVRKCQQAHDPELQKIADTIETLRVKIKGLEAAADAEKADFAEQVRLLLPYVSGRDYNHIRDYGVWAARSFYLNVPMHQKIFDYIRFGR